MIPLYRRGESEFFSVLIMEYVYSSYLNHLIICLCHLQVIPKTRVSEFGTCQRGESIMLAVYCMICTNDMINFHKADKQLLWTL